MKNETFTFFICIMVCLGALLTIGGIWGVVSQEVVAKTNQSVWVVAGTVFVMFCARIIFQ